MARLQITEYRDCAEDSRKLPMPAPLEPAEVDYALEIGVQSVQGEPFRDATRLVMLCADESCYLSFGENPTAQDTNQRLEAGVSIFRGVQRGHRVAALLAAD